MNQCKTLPWNQLEATRAPPHPLTIDHSDGYTLGGSQIVGGSLPSRGIARFENRRFSKFFAGAVSAGSDVPVGMKPPKDY